MRQGSEVCPWLAAHTPSLCLPCCSSITLPVSSGPCQGVWIFWKPLWFQSLPLYTPCPCRENKNVLLSPLATRIKGSPRQLLSGRIREIGAPQFSEAQDGCSRSQLCVQGRVNRRQERTGVETDLLVKCSELGHLAALVLVPTSGLLQSFCKACPPS